MLLQAEYSVELWFLVLEVDVSKHKSYPTILLPVSCLKAGSHRGRQRQRYRSVAVTSNVKVFTQKILAVTEVIFLISSVLR